MVHLSQVPDSSGSIPSEPPHEVFPVSGFTPRDGLLLFAKCNREVWLAFNTRTKNEASQWSISTVSTGCFWSTHLWTWVVKRRPLWYDWHALDSPRRGDFENAHQ